MDKFSGGCNGVSDNKNDQEFLSYSNQSKPNSLEMKSGSENYINVQQDKGIKEFKNKFK